MPSSAPDRTACVVPVDPGRAGPSIFMVHGADGGVDYARALARHLPAGFDVWGVRMEGYESAPPPPRTLPELAGRYVRELKAVQPEGPYLLAGYSIGGTLAFEMARQLEEQDGVVALVVLVDSRFPPRPDDGQGPPAVAALPRPKRPLHQRLWRRWIRQPVKSGVASLCIRLGWPLPGFWGIRTRYYWRMLATSRDAYQPSPIDARILVVGADGTTSVHRDTWAALSRAGGEVTEIPVGHLELVMEPWVQELAHHVRSKVTAALRLSEVDGGSRWGSV